MKKHSRIASAALVAALLCRATFTWAADPPPSPTAVTLLGADERGAISVATRGGAPVPLTLVVRSEVAGHKEGLLGASPSFVSQDQPPVVAIPTIRTMEQGGDATSRPVVHLTSVNQVAISLDFDRLVPGKTYKGKLFLTSGELSQQWDLTVVVAGRGAFAVAPVPTLKFLVGPFSEDLCGAIGSFPITVYDKTEGGQYHNLHVSPRRPSRATCATQTKRSRA